MATVQLNISLTPAARNTIKDRAEELGIPVSQFVVQKALDLEHGRHDFIPDLPTREEFEEVKEIVADLKRLAENSGAL